MHPITDEAVSFLLARAPAYGADPKTLPTESADAIHRHLRAAAYAEYSPACSELRTALRRAERDGEPVTLGINFYLGATSAEIDQANRDNRRATRAGQGLETALWRMAAYEQATSLKWLAAVLTGRYDTGPGSSNTPPMQDDLPAAYALRCRLAPAEVAAAEKQAALRHAAHAEWLRQRITIPPERWKRNFPARQEHWERLPEAQRHNIVDSLR